MKQILLAALILSCLVPPALAAGLEREIKSDWLGAWVVTGVETWSDCAGLYTNNRVNGMLVKSRGDQRFQPGELAKIHKIDVKRSRMDVHLALAEPLLLPYPEGPFTLYREAECRVELEIEIPRDLVRAKDADAVDEMLARLVEPYATVEAARASATWNGREMDPYPDDYEHTLARVAVWRAEQTNAAVQAKLDAATDLASRMADRLSSDVDYLAGFATGIEEARGHRPDTCPLMLAADLAGGHGHSRHRSHRRDHEDASNAEARRERGREDGRLLIVGLDLVRRLPMCFVPVPQVETVDIAASGD